MDIYGNSSDDRQTPTERDLTTEQNTGPTSDPRPELIDHIGDDAQPSTGEWEAAAHENVDYRPAETGLNLFDHGRRSVGQLDREALAVEQAQTTSSRTAIEAAYRFCVWTIEIPDWKDQIPGADEITLSPTAHPSLFQEPLKLLWADTKSPTIRGMRSKLVTVFDRALADDITPDEFADYFGRFTSLNKAYDAARGKPIAKGPADSGEEDTSEDPTAPDTEQGLPDPKKRRAAQQMNAPAFAPWPDHPLLQSVPGRIVAVGGQDGINAILTIPDKVLLNLYQKYGAELESSNDNEPTTIDERATTEEGLQEAA